MRRVLVALGLLFASVLFAADPKDCVSLSARQDNDVSSPSGVRVTVNGYNRCNEEFDGYSYRFKVNAIGTGGKVIASQAGTFGGTIAPGGRVETKVFVLCDPDRVRSITVEAH
jgi:hypothetical protein